MTATCCSTRPLTDLRCFVLFLIAPAALTQDLGVLQKTSQVTSTTCTCDCCTTVERSPAEVTIGQNSERLNFKCVEGALTVCSSSCTALNAELEVDYSRYCLEDCHPALNSIGSVCLAKVDALTNVTLDRGGIPMTEGPSAAAASPAPGSPSTETAGGTATAEPTATSAAAAAPAAAPASSQAAVSPWEAKAQKQKAADLAKAEAAANVGTEQRVVVRDYSSSIAERLTAEASAYLSRSAAIGEGIKESNAALQKDAEMIQKVAEAAGELPTGVNKAVSLTTSEAAVAEGDLASVKLALKASRAGALVALRGAQTQAADAIRSAVEPLVAEEAEANLKFDEEATNRVLAIKALKAEVHSEGLLSEARALEDSMPVSLAAQSAHRASTSSKRLPNRATSLEREV